MVLPHSQPHIQRSLRSRHPNILGRAGAADRYILWTEARLSPPKAVLDRALL